MKNISYNFGALKDSILRLSTLEIIKEDESKTLNKFLDKISTDSDLKKQQLIYKNIQDAKPFSKDRLAERFLKQNLSMFKNSNWNNICETNKRLRKDLLGAPDTSHVEARENGSLFESINVLIESVTKPGFSDWESEAKAFDEVISHLTREVIKEEESKEKDDAPSLNNAWRFLTQSAVSNFKERYEHLNESEQEILNTLMSSSSDKINFLNKIKTESVNLIDSMIESSEANDYKILSEFKEKLESITPEKINNDNIDTFILECVDLKQNLEDF